MLKIRLKKFGRHKHPTYRLVVQDAVTRRDGPAVEILGWYDPAAKGEQLKFDLERVQYWLSQGAQATEKAAALIKRAGRPSAGGAKPAQAAAAHAPQPAAAGEPAGPAAQPPESAGDKPAE